MLRTVQYQCTGTHEKKHAHCSWALLFCVFSRFISDIFIVLSDIESYFKLNSCSFPPAFACFNYWHDYYYYHFIGIPNDVRHTNQTNHKPTDTHSFRKKSFSFGTAFCMWLMWKRAYSKSRVSANEIGRNDNYFCVCDVRVLLKAVAKYFSGKMTRSYLIWTVIHK